MIEFHPAYVLLLGAFLAAILPQRLRQGVMILAPAVALLLVLQLKSGTTWTMPFINNLDLVLLKVDDLSWIFGLVFSTIALLANIYALHIKSPGESAAGLVYAGSSLGVVFAGDWLTLIFFWELMAVSSTLLIWYRREPESIKAGFRYILVHFLGGNILLAGIFMKISAGGFAITALTGTNDAAFWLILLGISINAAIPPLHAWLTDAYPEGTITGSVFLSAFTTKVAVYCMIRVFPGTELLIWAGTIMAIYGVVYAILENDMRRLLSYHIVCQVGYMIATVGMGTDLALNGGVAHAFNNILYKTLLFMGVGVVIHATGLRKLSELGGLFQKMKFTAILYMIGALAISGVPLFNGFISKPMVMSAATHHHLPFVELALYLAGIGTFLSLAMKIPYFVFFGPERGIEPKEIPLNMYVAMTGCALLCIIYGIFPSLLYNYLPFAATYEPYSLDHVISTIQLLVATIAAFCFFIPKFSGAHGISLDTDWFYRKPVVFLMNGVVNIVCRIRDEAGVQGSRLLNAVVPFFDNPLRWDPQTADGGTSAIYGEDRYRFPVGLTVLMTIFVFIVFVLYYSLT